MVTVRQLHVVRGQIRLGTSIEVVEEGPVQGFLVAGTGRRYAACVLVRNQGVTTGVEAGILGLDNLIPKFIVPRSLGHELRGHRIGAILPVADTVALLGLVAVVAGIQANERNGSDVASNRPGLVYEAIHVEVVVEARNIVYTAVVSKRGGLCRILREAARNAGVSELIAQAADPVRAPLLLPDHAVVDSSSCGARCVVDELLEVILVGVAAFLERHRGTAVRIAVDAGVIARYGILAAEGQLAQLLAFEADPRVAVEQDSRGIHLAGVKHEFAFQFEDHIWKRRRKRMPAGDSPPVAAEPRDLIIVLVIAVGVGIADVTQRDVDRKTSCR